jgi:hypothetical protein
MEGSRNDDFRQVERGTRVAPVYRYQVCPPLYNLCHWLVSLAPTAPVVRATVATDDADGQHENNRQINCALGDRESGPCKNRIQDKRNSV